MEIIFAKIAVIIGAIFGIEANLYKMPTDLDLDPTLQQCGNINDLGMETEGGLRLGEKFLAR